MDLEDKPQSFNDAKQFDDGGGFNSVIPQPKSKHPRADEAYEFFMQSGHTNHDLLRDLCYELEAELSSALEKLSNYSDAYAMLENKIVGLEQELASLRQQNETLRKYSRHTVTCGVHEGQSCDCGFDEALNQPK